MTPQHPIPNSAPCPTGVQTRPAGLPNTEKPDLADQKTTARLERIESFLRRHQALFATQGTVVATWRVYRNRRLGPYFQIVYRHSRRQRALYIGRSKELADRVRRLLHQFQRSHRTRRLYKRLQTQARASLRRAKAQLRRMLALRGIALKGFEFRGVRHALPLPPVRLAASAAALGKIPPYGGHTRKAKPVDRAHAAPHDVASRSRSGYPEPIG